MSTPSRARGLVGRVLLRVAVAALLGLFLGLGRLLSVNDPLDKADAIYVLAGSRMDRPLEGAFLYQEGYGSVLVLSRDKPDGAERYLETRHAIPYRSGADLARENLLAFGIPADAMLIPPELHENTAQEASTIARLARERAWRRVIVVTSVYHTQRAGYALHRALSGTGVEVLMRWPRLEEARPATWWLNRDDLKYVASEAPKFAAYFLGLAE